MNIISPLAYIEEGAQIGENVKIGPFCCIYSDTVIGDGTILENSVTVFPGCDMAKTIPRKLTLENGKVYRFKVTI